jgi:hypothetical protein
MSKGILAVLLIAALVIAGCGGSGTIKAASSPQTKAEIAKAEVVVKACLSKSKTPKAFASCVAPPGHTAALQSCAIKAFTSDFPLHKGRLQGDLAECVVKNR